MRCDWTVGVCMLGISLCGFVSAQTVINYEAFGAVGDGKTDDMKAIVAAHAAANAQGLPVKVAAGKTYYIGEAPLTAIVKTDVDFGTAKFVIDDVKVALKQRGAPIFSIVSDQKPFAVKGVSTLTRGQTSIGVTLPSDCLLVAFDKNVRQYIRYGANQNNGSPQQEVFLCDKTGTVDPRAPIVWNFKQVTGLTAYPVDAKTLVVKGGVFTTIANQAESRYTYYGRGISVTRSNVRIEGLRHEVTGELDHGAPYSGFVGVSKCANVTITGCVFTAHKTYQTIGSAGVPVRMGSYDITANTAVNISYVNCRQTTDIKDSRYWGLFGSNYCKNLLYDGCEFSRFDAHMGVANATIRNCRLGYMGINAIGFGTFRIENSTVYGGNFINLRSDYGSTWEGDFVIRNCTFVPACGRSATGNLVGGSYSGLHDFGYPCHMPRRILVEGLHVDDTNHPKNYKGPCLFSDFNKKNVNAEYVETYPYHITKEVVLKNVTTASGKPFATSSNPWMFRNVKVTIE